MAHSTSRLGLSRSRSAPARRAPVACAPPVVRVAGVLSLLGGWRWLPGGASPPSSSERKKKQKRMIPAAAAAAVASYADARSDGPAALVHPKCSAGRVGIMIQ